MGRGFGDVPDNSKRDSVRESEIFEIYPLNKKAEGNWVTLRLLDTDLLPIKKHWIKIMGGKDKDKEIKIPRICVQFDPDNQSQPLKGRKCPYCGIQHGNDESGAPAQYDFKWYAQAIIRDVQASAPRKMPKMTKNEQKTGKKEMGSDSWTPVQCIPLSNNLAGRIRELGERNIHMVKDKKSGKKSKQAFQVNHPKYGCDIEVKYSKSKAPADRYTIERGDPTPLTEEEKGYLIWDFENWSEIYDMLGRMDSKGALEDFKRMDVMGGSSRDDDDDHLDDDDEDDDMSLGRKKKGGKSSSKDKSKSKSKRSRDEDDEDDDDDDEDDRPSKKKAKPSRSSRLLDDDEDDEDEDEKPKKKKVKSKSSKLKSSSSSKSKRSRDEDDEDDEDEKPKKKAKSSKLKSSSKSSSLKSKKKKSVDDDEDDLPKKKKKKKK